MNGPLPGVPGPLTVPASWLYGLVIEARNARFDRGNGVACLELPVISVGNITVGGVGKTPMVLWIAAWLLGEGHEPMIAMRGYRARRGEPGDEQTEHLGRLPGVHVVADPDRVSALKASLPRHPGVDCVLLDDGFQHRRLKRDLDLVLIDATRDTMSDRLLPRGYLREPLENLRRAHAVVVTRAGAVEDGLAAKIEGYHGKPPIAWSRHVWTRLAVWASCGRPRDEAVGWLRGKRVTTLLGVGNPQSIVDQLDRAGASIAADIRARDHERYGRAKISRARSLCEGVDAMVMTGKDWVKVRRLIDPSSWPVSIVVPRLEIDVFEGADQLKDLIRRALSA